MGANEQRRENQDERCACFTELKPGQTVVCSVHHYKRIEAATAYEGYAAKVEGRLPNLPAGI